MEVWIDTFCIDIGDLEKQSSQTILKKSELSGEETRVNDTESYFSDVQEQKQYMTEIKNCFWYMISMKIKIWMTEKNQYY